MNNRKVAQNKARIYYKSKSNPCALCGSSSTIMHHEDYNEPLNVIWLCRTCHGLYHKNKLLPEHIAHIKTLYKWFYIKQWITYDWYVDNKTLYFKRSRKLLSTKTDNSIYINMYESGKSI